MKETASGSPRCKSPTAFVLEREKEELGKGFPLFDLTTMDEVCEVSSEPL